MLSTKKIILYALLALPLSFATLPIYIYLPQFYAQNFAINLQQIGLILLACRLLDAFFDPLLGIFSDKYSHLKKKMIFFSAPILGVSFLMLFAPQTGFNIGFWLFFSLFATYFFFSLIQINYQSLALSLSDNYNQKTKIVAMREGFGVAGIILASIAPAILLNYFSSPKTFLILGVFHLLVICALAALFYFFSHTPSKLSLERPNKQKFSFLKISDLKKFFLLFFINSIALSIPAVLILFFIEKVVDAKSFTGLFMSCYFFGLLAGIPLWAKIATILNNKINAWKIAMSLVILIFFCCYFVGKGDIIFYATICALSGLCFGADYCLSYSILADLIQENKLEKNETTIFGVINFITKFSFSVASGVLIFLLGKIQESQLVLEESFLSFCYVIVSCLFKIFALFVLINFSKKYAPKF
jgi:Na+/melibiose symporter-like transporter